MPDKLITHLRQYVVRPRRCGTVEMTVEMTVEDISTIRNSIVPGKAAPAVPPARPRRRNRERCQ